MLFVHVHVLIASGVEENLNSACTAAVGREWLQWLHSSFIDRQCTRYLSFVRVSLPCLHNTKVSTKSLPFAIFISADSRLLLVRSSSLFKFTSDVSCRSNFVLACEVTSKPASVKLEFHFCRLFPIGNEIMVRLGNQSSSNSV